MISIFYFLARIYGNFFMYSISRFFSLSWVDSVIQVQNPLFSLSLFETLRIMCTFVGFYHPSHTISKSAVKKSLRSIWLNLAITDENSPIAELKTLSLSFSLYIDNNKNLSITCCNTTILACELSQISNCFCLCSEKSKIKNS